MTAADYLARAEHLNHEVRVTRDCDALDPCGHCRAKGEAARGLRHLARMAELDARFSGSAALAARGV